MTTRNKLFGNKAKFDTTPKPYNYLIEESIKRKIPLKTRIEKVRYGDLWATKRIYKIGDKVVGEIVRNPYTDKFEVLASDFKNYKYINTETKTLSQAIKIIKEYQKTINRKK